ncbi:60S ribosomal protein L14 [Halotydeus destructor]|nr:60S ribosomal protein L14 [Halotydeus destructor]
MPTKHFVEIGRVALINHGPDAGKTAAIVDVIDQNRALLDGPSFDRKPVAFSRLRLTRFRVRIPNGTSTEVVKKAWAKAEIDKNFATSKLAKRLANNNRREQLTDFDRFKLYKTKQRVNRLINAEVARLVSAEKKAKKAKK